MADIRAFRGWRYNLARVGELSAVVAPPYDVIDAELEQTLLSKHPCNIVRVELAKEPPGDSTDERYARAARFLHDWKLDGTLVEETSPSIYVLHQQFDVEGRSYTRRGFLARLRVEPFGSGQVYAHEETMAGPKADRLRLYRATGMNVSPILGMYPDSENAVQDVLERAVQNRTPIVATDHLGVVSRLWPLSDQELVTRVRGLMGPRPIFIADGHHRYETAIRFRDERLASGSLRDDESTANFCLMMCVSMSDPGLAMLPTHRLVSGIGELDCPSLHTILGREFDVEWMGDGPDGGQAAWEMIEADGGQNLIGFGSAADQRWLLARLRSTAAMERLVPQHSEAWRALGVSILHELVVAQLLRDRFPHALPRFQYVHLLREVREALAGRACTVACLVPPATMDHVQRIACANERMPAKSTYFYPKLLTGLVLNPIS